MTAYYTLKVKKNYLLVLKNLVVQKHIRYAIEKLELH